jgi:hypothetical protein
VGKYRSLIIAGIIILALAAFFLFVPMRDLSGQNIATVVTSRIIAPSQPRITPVILPPDVQQFVTDSRTWFAGWVGQLDSGGASFERNAPKELRERALSLLASNKVSPEIKVYLLWWIQDNAHSDLTDQVISPYLEPSFYNQLRDRAHYLLLKKILTRYLTPLLAPEGYKPPFSADTVRKMQIAQIQLLTEAAKIPPRDSFSQLIAMQAAYETVVDEKGQDIWLKATDEEKQKYSKQALPYLKAFLQSKRGWLVAEPTWFTSLRAQDLFGPQPFDQSVYELLSSEATSVLMTVDSMIAADASARGDWKTVLLTVDAIGHLSDIYPENEDKGEGLAFLMVLPSINPENASPGFKEKFAKLRNDWWEPFTKAFEVVSQEGAELGPNSAKDAIATTSGIETPEEAKQRIDEFILRLRKLVEEEAKAMGSKPK